MDYTKVQAPSLLRIAGGYRCTMVPDRAMGAPLSRLPRRPKLRLLNEPQAAPRLGVHFMTNGMFLPCAELPSGRLNLLAGFARRQFRNALFDARSRR